MMKEAAYYETEKDGIRCKLCPHYCFISEGKRGFCRVRRNISQTLIAESWGIISSVNLDPVEKKPLYHFFPGEKILSIGSLGCNMICKCCQNWEISQTSIPNSSRVILPIDVVESAVNHPNNIGVAYTYNEPSIGFEFMLETAGMIKEKGLKNVMVSNGYISKEPLLELLSVVDAFNIDLKGFNPHFYRTFTGATLRPVLETLQTIRSAGRHLEITCLIVPTQNDDPVEFRKMTDWIVDTLGSDTVLHLSGYHPDYKLDIVGTPVTMLDKLLHIARERLFHVYAGNVNMEGFQNTRCSKCMHEVILRSGYRTEIKGLKEDGSCIYCGNKEIIR